MKNQTINTKIIHKIETASGALQNALEIELSSLSKHPVVIHRIDFILQQLESLQGLVSECEYVEDNPSCVGCDCLVKDWNFKKGVPVCATCKKNY